MTLDELINSKAALLAEIELITDPLAARAMLDSVAEALPHGDSDMPEWNLWHEVREAALCRLWQVTNLKIFGVDLSLEETRNDTSKQTRGIGG